LQAPRCGKDEKSTGQDIGDGRNLIHFPASCFEEEENLTYSGLLVLRRHIAVEIA